MYKEQQEHADRVRSMRGTANILGDMNCCSVIAVAVVAECSYVEAASVLAALGRRRNKGCFTTMIEDALNVFGVTMEHQRLTGSGLSVRAVLETMCGYDDVGMVAIDKHILCYGAGVCCDSPSSMNAQAIVIWRVTERLERGIYYD